MSKISFLKVNSFLGVDELEVEPGKINIFKGPTGSGKTSVIEAIEKTFTNKSRRTEVIKHGEEEATLFVELDDGLEIDRRVRTEKGDYLKVRKSDEGVPSTEKFLRTLVNGNIFRPLDWVNLSVKEQTKSLLRMLEIGWSEENDGITIDSDSRVRINETLIEGLSTGEKLSLAMKVAKAQAGDLKVICLDGFESIDKVLQAKLLAEMTYDEYQYFVTEVVSTENNKVEIEKIG